jgi:Amt family ammonium transporter
MVVPVYAGADSNFLTQFIGFASIGGFVFVTSLTVWFVLKVTMGIRVSEEAEITGLDVTELGMEAYPEFSKG